MAVDPRTFEASPTHTIASGNDVSFMSKLWGAASANGKAIPSLGGRLGRWLSPLIFSARLPATATQRAVGSSLTTTVRCWVDVTTFVSRPPEHAGRTRVAAATRT